MNNLVAAGLLHSFDPMHRHGQALADHGPVMSENFICYIPSSCSIARLEPPPDFIPVPVFRSELPVVDDDPGLVGGIIHGVTESIRRELQVLRAQEAARNSTSVTLEIAMAMLGCKRSKIFDLLLHGLLERAPRVGRSVMISRSSIEALIMKGLPQKSGKRLQRPECVTRNTRTGKGEKNIEVVKQRQEVGALIRKIAI